MNKALLILGGISFLLVLVLWGCATAPVKKEHTHGAVTGFVVTLDDETAGFILIGTDGVALAVTAEDCAGDDSCMATVERLRAEKNMDTIGLESECKSSNSL